MGDLGAIVLEHMKKRGKWLRAFFSVLAALVALNLFFRPHDPHFTLDAYPGFWAVFGLVVGAAMVFAMKKIVQPLIVRKEDYYNDL